MAGDSVIGALRVDLGLNSAQFTTGLKSADLALKSFGKNAGLALGAVAAAAAAATVALGIAVKGAIDHADALSKAAQKAGVTVEALSRIAYAAQFSEISLDEMTASLGKLSKTMADATQNVHGASASAFAALGINVTDASGKLRGADAVFSEVADRFSRLQDGATKTAISMALFGKSGAQLIPLLNEGATGLKRYADESDRLGNTISTKTAASANQFNDTLTKIGSILGGVVNKVMVAALPALQSLADTLSSPAFEKAAEAIGVGLVNAVNLVANAFANAVNWGQQFLNLSQKLAETQGRKPTARPGTVEYARQSAAIAASDPTGAGPNAGELSSFLPSVPITVHGGASAPSINTDLFTEGLGRSAEAATKKTDLLKKALDDIGPAGKTAADMASESLRNLGQNAFGSLANLSGALSHLFKQNKAFAVATAVLQGLQGVAYALGSSAPPWNFINAAAVGIESAANVANILSTNENSTSMPTTSGGSAGQAAAAGQAGSAINLTIKGSGMFSVDDFVNQIAQGIADGGHQSLLKVIKAS